MSFRLTQNSLKASPSTLIGAPNVDREAFKKNITPVNVDWEAFDEFCVTWKLIEFDQFPQKLKFDEFSHSENSMKFVLNPAVDEFCEVNVETVI